MSVNLCSLMKAKKARALKIFVLSIFMSAFLVGCSKSGLPLKNKYDRKQIRCCNLESNYLICKECVNYTKIKKVGHDYKGEKSEKGERCGKYNKREKVRKKGKNLGNKKSDFEDSKTNLKMKQVNNSWRV